ETCLKPQPDERYADAQALKDALQTALAADLAGPNAQAAAAIAMPPGAPPQPRRPSLEQAAVPKSFNVDAALSAVDDTHERWLIQKDKLDFGPFSMKDVRSQIEQGKIKGEHVTIATENGQRQHVRDHAQLRQIV